ncbi:MAG TPA: NAD(P)-dependent alcohol dehydrogenase [Rhizomicrobium sp.]
MTRSMQALRVVQPGKMPQVVSLPVPEPGPGQVRIRVAGAGLCHSDLLVIHADPSFFPLPLTLGHETTGWVDALGDGARGATVGDAVAVYFPWGCGHCARCARGEENICTVPTFGPGAGRDGGMADYLLVDDARHLIPLGSLDPVQAAPLMCAGLTTYHAIHSALDVLEPGTSIVLIGIGGLGHLAVQIARALSPAQIIAVDRHQVKLDQARQHGAHHAVQGGEGAGERIRALTGNEGAALVLDMVGNDATMALGLSVLGYGGRLKIVGVGGGTLPATFYAMPRDSSINAPYAGTLRDGHDIVRLAQSGLVKAEVERIGFGDVLAAYERMDRGQLRGRAVLVPGT